MELQTPGQEGSEQAPVGTQPTNRQAQQARHPEARKQALADTDQRSPQTQDQATADTRPIGRRVQRARDPEARRQALSAATIEVIAEAGIGRTTHRAVAARADLPLGATTYYFPTLDALIAAGLRHATQVQEGDLREWADRLRDAPDLAATLVALVGECLADRRQSRIEYELYVAAARDAALRPLAVAWLDGLHELLAPRVGFAAARNISALLDGATLQALVTGTDLDTGALTDAIRRLTAS
jgi:DNA-binding transcriptional regulator YbjK